VSLPIAEYALIGDMRSTALVSRGGSIDWLCWPRHDSPALFLRLLDDAKGGACTIAWAGEAVIARRYLPGTNILETRFVLPTGVAVLLDFMPVAALPTPPARGPDTAAPGAVVRILRCEHGAVSGRFRVEPSFDYARRAVAPRPLGQTTARFEAGEHRLLVRADRTLALSDRAVEAAFTLGAGEEATLVLGHHDALPVPATALAETRAYWEAWSARCRYQGPYRAAVLRSALCLKLLTDARTGAIIAAPTTSLPEAVPGNRNYDYRYVWVRDASFTVTSFLGLGYLREPAEYLRFLRRADRSNGRALRLIYGIDDDPLPETTLDHLAGWRGVGPVRVGNGAAGQRQFDIYGELLLALDAYVAAAGTDGLHDGLRESLGNLVAACFAARNEPDSGIWELRVAPQHSFHTKALLWVAFDRAVRIGRRIGIDEARLAEWAEAGAGLRRDYLARGWNPRRNAFTQAYGSDVLDAAVLRSALFGAIPPDDPRLRATLDAIVRELGAGDLLYRYRMPDGLEGEEATFAACAFWRVGCLALTGALAEAEALFDRLLARANDVGLFAEEIDAATGEHRGNFPQGFTHMAVINHALRLQSLATGHPALRPDEAPR
jgi:GH15 family glucan-1,4-alpha-glucosidase